MCTELEVPKGRSTAQHRSQPENAEDRKQIMESSLQRCSPRSCPESSNTLCIMCCHVMLICVSSAGSETFLELFAIGIKPKQSNVVVRLPGGNKGDKMVWGFEHRT